jgi:hypothetical protein
MLGETLNLPTKCTTLPPIPTFPRKRGKGNGRRQSVLTGRYFFTHCPEAVMTYWPEGVREMNSSPLTACTAASA